MGWCNDRWSNFSRGCKSLSVQLSLHPSSNSSTWRSCIAMARFCSGARFGSGGSGGRATICRDEIATSHWESTCCTDGIRKRKGNTQCHNSTDTRTATFSQSSVKIVCFLTIHFQSSWSLLCVENHCSITSVAGSFHVCSHSAAVSEAARTILSAERKCPYWWRNCPLCRKHDSGNC